MEDLDLLSIETSPKKDAIIKVIGVGGGGSNAVNYMYTMGINDVDFVVCNTDVQALRDSPVSTRIQIGKELTSGLGAGSIPQRGRDSAIENIDSIEAILRNNTKMAFITAGMGGGTGTGAAPIIAKKARELGILTVGIVTIPFYFEGRKRLERAIEGIREISSNVDAILIINNQRLREMYGDLKLSEAFAKADDVLAIAARSIAEIITSVNNINIDFRDVMSVTKNAGVAVMGAGDAAGKGRGVMALEKALTSPLLNSSNIYGAENILLNVVSGDGKFTAREMGEVTRAIEDKVGDRAEVIWGYGTDSNLGDKVRITIIATGFTRNPLPCYESIKETEEEEVVLDVVNPDEVKESSKPLEDFTLCEDRVEILKKEEREKERRKKLRRKSKLDEAWVVKAVASLFSDKDTEM